MNRKLHVLYLITTLRPYGGAERALANLLPYLDRNVVNVWVGTVFDRDPHELTIEGLEDCVRHFRFGSRYYLDLIAYWRLIRFLRENRIDVIHTHLFAANTVGRIAGRLAGVPVRIATEHNTYLAKSARLHLVDRVLARITSRIVAVSPPVLDYAARVARIPREKFVFIPNNVRLERLGLPTHQQKSQLRKSLGIASDALVILAVGRLTEQKGFSYLIEAASEVCARHERAIFLIAGTGELRESLERQVLEAGLQGVVRFLGYRPDIADLMKSSDLLVMSSLWEGLPVVLIEAGACGLPAVVTNVPGSTEIVCDGENGQVVSVADSGALAAAIGALLESEPTRQRMAQRAFVMVKDRFSGPVVARQVLATYEACLREAGQAIAN